MKIFTLSILFAVFIFSSITSSAQISLINSGYAIRFLKTDTKPNRPSHFGLGLGLSADFKDKNRITLSSALNFPVFWDADDKIKAYDTSLCKFPLSIAVCEERMKTFEISALYSYYLAGRCNSFADVYASAGGGLIFYDGIVDFQNKPHFSLKESRANMMLDLRLGAEVWITIGYFFLEAKFAPKLFNVIESDMRHKEISSYIGANTGVRFLVTQPFSKSKKGPTILDQE
jgi:hypothetical protein